VELDGGYPVLLRVAGWNLEWFGDPSDGPTDEELQYTNVRSILREGGLDLYGLVEVVNPSTFERLLTDLPDYRGLLASDTAQVAQPATCDSSSHSPCYRVAEQKPAFLYKPSVMTVRGAQLILTEPSNDHALAGRAPLRVDLTVRKNGFQIELVVIVLHLKAYADVASYQRRLAAAQALKDYVDRNLANQKVLVLGDWNDDVDQSTTSSGGVLLPSPFEAFIDDPAGYTFVTATLSRAGARSTVNFPNVIDHHLVTSPLASLYLRGSAAVLRPDLWGDSNYALGSYVISTSDHYPVESQYVLGVLSEPALPLAPEEKSARYPEIRPGTISPFTDSPTGAR